MEENKSIENTFDQLADLGWKQFDDTRKKSIQVKRIKTLAIIVLAIAMLSCLLFYLIKNKDRKVKKTDSSSIHHSKALEQNNALILPKNKVITQRNNNKKNKALHQFIEVQIETDCIEINNCEDQNIQNKPLKNLALPIEISQIDNKIIKKKAKEKYLHDFLTVDYQEKPKFKAIFTGLAANFEKNPSYVVEENQNDSYRIDYLSSGLSYLKTKNLIQAEQCFKKSLLENEHNINAQFYLAYCFYLMNKEEEASFYFNQVIANEYGNFDEDAQLFLSKIKNKLSLK